MLILFSVNLNFRYHQFKGEWQANKAPGEKSHKNLRWNVRVNCQLKIQKIIIQNGQANRFCKHYFKNDLWLIVSDWMPKAYFEIILSRDDFQNKNKLLL